MPLHLDYRPLTFEEFIGNETTIKKLKVMLERKDKQHAMLFYGPSRCGKTTLARIVGTMLGCEEIEQHELNAADTRGIETIREIIKQSHFQPLLGSIKVYILDEAHGITGQAADALLKLLEDTPEHMYLMLCTTAPELLKDTIRKRCAPFEVKKLNETDLRKLLKWVIDDVKSRNPDVNIHKDTIDALVTGSEGAPGWALVLLDQILKMTDKDEQLNSVFGGMIDDVKTLDLCRALVAQGKGLDKWRKVQFCLEGLNEEHERTRRGVLGYFQAILMESNKVEEKVEDKTTGKMVGTGKMIPRWPIRSQAEADRIFHIMNCFEQSFFYTGKPGLILACYKACQI